MILQERRIDFPLVRILVTGGAGYIGSHVVRLLVGRGDHVVVVDDLLNGDASRLDGLEVQKMDIHAGSAAGRLESILRAEQIDSVIHFAARKQVAESVARPAWYFQQNIGSIANVLLAMESAGVGRLVFSSSASVYGVTEGAHISESDPAHPINPYGQTKLIGEQLVTASAAAFDLTAASLRYFNVAGAGSPELGDHAVLNLVPMVLERLDAGKAPEIYGDDYETPDGTCVRDYVHVLDLAEAHIATLDHLSAGGRGHTVFNVGTGVGTSVKEMVAAISRATGISREPRVSSRRVGDPAFVVASPRRIQDAVGWRARRNIDDIVGSAVEAHYASAMRRD